VATLAGQAPLRHRSTLPTGRFEEIRTGRPRLWPLLLVDAL